MRRRYASTFISGLQEVVNEMLAQLVSDLKVDILLDGLIVYQTQSPPDVLRKAPFLNNTFMVLDLFEKLPNNPLDAMLASVARGRELERRVALVVEPAEAGKTFRLIASDENQFVPIAQGERETLERRISAVRGLRVNRIKPELEFWFLYRSEGYGFFMKRVTARGPIEKNLEKGELRPELAYTLCFLSEPDRSDIFLDPFAGHGSIPMRRALSFPYNMIFAADTDQEQIQFIRNRLKKAKVKPTFILKKMDALSMSAFQDGFIHKIVTDPPWGFFETLDMDIQEFYRRMLQEFWRVLREGGLIVVLTARKEEFESALSYMRNMLALRTRYDILVSGKKAAIFKLSKL